MLFKVGEEIEWSHSPGSSLRLQRINYSFVSDAPFGVWLRLVFDPTRKSQPNANAALVFNLCSVLDQDLVTATMKTEGRSSSCPTSSEFPSFDNTWAFRKLRACMHSQDTAKGKESMLEVEHSFKKDTRRSHLLNDHK